LTAPGMMGSSWVHYCLSVIPLHPKQAGIIIIVIILALMLFGAYVLSKSVLKLPNSSNSPEIYHATPM